MVFLEECCRSKNVPALILAAQPGDMVMTWLTSDEVGLGGLLEIVSTGFPLTPVTFFAVSYAVARGEALSPVHSPREISYIPSPGERTATAWSLCGSGKAISMVEWSRHMALVVDLWLTETLPGTQSWVTYTFDFLILGNTQSRVMPTFVCYMIKPSCGYSQQPLLFL